AIGAQRAPQLAGRALVELGLAQPRQRRGRVVEPELGRQLGAVGAVADHAAVRAQAGQEPQRVHQQRLAGAGFTRDHGHARAELEFGAGDHGEVTNGEAQEHRRIVAALAPATAGAYIGHMVRGRVTHASLDPRARQLLRTLISRYIRDGAPVGSQTLARHAGLDVSPATIRNILADLEDVGLLSSPHTSAGRVPTAQGYRVFVDSLLQPRPLPEAELQRLRQELPSGPGTQALLGSATELLSAMTHFVGVVSVPRRAQFAFRDIDFVPLDAGRVLAILVFADNDVQNLIIQVRRPYEA